MMMNFAIKFFLSRKSKKSDLCTNHLYVRFDILISRKKNIRIFRKFLGLKQLFKDLMNLDQEDTQILDDFKSI